MSSHQWNHYLAQSYLKGFSPYYYQPDATAKQKMKVWCFDKEKKTITMLNADKVARNPRWYSLKTGNQTYDNAVEKDFGTFEQYYVGLIGKIRGWIDLANRQSSGLDLDKPFDATLTETEKAYFASYLALHILRVPSFFGNLRKMAKTKAAADQQIVAA